MKITSKNIEQILYCDYRKDKNKQLIQDVLHTIPKFRKSGSGVPLEAIEGLITEVTGKYAITTQWITFTRGKEDDVYWSCCLRNDSNYQYLTTITAFCMYELLAKISIYLFAMVKGYNGGLITREELEIEREWKGVDDGN